MLSSPANPVGIGTDLIEVARIAKAVERHGDAFLNKILTHSEQVYCQGYRNPLPRIAARFAAKEAISKALGVGISKDLGWHDMEIGHNAQGMPTATLSDTAANFFGSPTIHLSISHTETHALAFVILTR